MIQYRLSLVATAVAAAFPLQTVFAQQAPDAGQTLQQQQQQAPQLPRTGPAVDVQTPASQAVLPGGTQVVLKSVSFSGNTRFSEAELLAQLGTVVDQSYDMAGLRGLVSRVSDFYRQSGYPFARAYLPPQGVSDGKLRIDVVEGRYGQVKAQGDDPRLAQAQAFLDGLRQGEVIDGPALERATLILDDQPGFKAAPIIRPGQELGTGDLDVRVTRERLFSGDVGLDNYGNRYTGEYRARVNVQADSPFLFGDQIQLRTLVSDEGMWMGSLNYSLPLGSSGLRGQVGYSHTYYELGKQFGSLNATGTAKVSTLGLSYPLLRSQQANATLGASWQHKRLNDRQGSTSADDGKYSDSLPLSVQFDLRDGLGGGGVTFGNVAWTHGKLHLDDSLLATDRTSARTAGDFDKWTLDVARLQNVAAGFVAYARVSAQWANKNIDSSEGFGLGGPNGVRAYPQGEGYGDEGWLGQLELRYSIGAFTPYAFYDAGEIRVNAKPWDNSQNRRRLAGGGLGSRFQQGDWSADLTVAWRAEGGEAQSDTRQLNPMVWLTLGYKF